MNAKGAAERRVIELCERASEKACKDEGIRPCAHPEFSELIKVIGYKGLIRELEDESSAIFADAELAQVEREHMKIMFSSHYESCGYCRMMEVNRCMRDAMLASLEAPGPIERLMRWWAGSKPGQVDLNPAADVDHGDATSRPSQPSPRHRVRSMHLVALTVALVLMLIFAGMAGIIWMHYRQSQSPNAAYSSCPVWEGILAAAKSAGITQMAICVRQPSTSPKVYSFEANTALTPRRTADADAFEQFFSALDKARGVKSKDFLVISPQGEVFITKALKIAALKASVRQKRPVSATGINLRLDDQNSVGALSQREMQPEPTERSGFLTYIEGQARGLKQMISGNP